MDSPTSRTEELLGEVAFVHRLARALLRDAGSAHDVAQDALTAALQQGPVRHVRGWLAAVTRHLAGRTRREALERARREARAARPPASDGEARTAERLRLHRRLTDAVILLPEPYRTAVTLRFFDELPPRAIAQRVGLPVATVRQHVHRGLAMLRQQLDGEFGGREQWRGAFGALALGKTTVPFLVWLPVLAMKKVVVGAALVAAVVGGWWSWPRSDAPPVTAQVASSPPSPATAEAADNATGAAAANVEALRTAAPATARDEAFVVRVVDEREEPIAGADVHRWTTAGALAKLRTDRDGRAEFAALDGAGGLVVRADGWTPLVRELAALRSDVTCTLADGALLDGTMLVDGAPAPAGLRLRFRTTPTLPASAPRALRETFDDRSAGIAVTSSGGAFVFRGLARGQSVTLELPRTHWFVPVDGVIDDSRDSLMERTMLPARGVMLLTTQLPTVYGRVVWADDGTAVVEPALMVYATFADGSNTPSMGSRGHQDGTFAAGFYPSSPSKWLRWSDPAKRTALAGVRLTAVAPGSDGSVRVDLDARALANMPIEIRLPRAAVMHFVVTDLEDHPIAGARVSATPGTPTDERGRGTFQGKLGGVMVGADGFQTQFAQPCRPAAGTEHDPLHFALAPRNLLVLRVRDQAGELPPIRSVRLVSRSGDLFFGKRSQNSFDVTFGGSEGGSSSTGRIQPDGSVETYEWICTAHPDATGRIELHSLEPGLACTADVIATLDTVVASVPFVTPPAGETMSLELVVQATARTVRGRVQARDGTPVPNATIRLAHGDNEAETTAKADGTFTFPAVYGDAPLQLAARAAGHVPVRRSVVAAEGAAEHLLVLEPGQRVTLRVVDHGDQPVAAHVVAELSPQDDARPQTLQPGEHLFVDLPRGVVTFACRLGGNRFTLAHDTANPTAVLRVPRPARLAVASPKGMSTHMLSARATRLDSAGEPFSLSIAGSELDTDLVVPGRYRIELIRHAWRGEGEQRELVGETVAPAQEVVAKAGELVRVTF